MDNDPKHTSGSTTRFIILNNINHFETPPQQPDLMPIEMVLRIIIYSFRIMKYIYSIYQVQNDLKRKTKGEKTKGNY